MSLEKYDTLLQHVRAGKQYHFVRSITVSARLSFWNNCMEQIPSWKVKKSSSARNKNSRTLLNMDVHYRVQNSAPRVPILSQIHPLHAFPKRFI